MAGFLNILIRLLAFCWFINLATSDNVSIPLCGSKNEVELTDNGWGSSAVFAFESEHSNSRCKIRLKAPISKTLAVQLYKVEEPFKKLKTYMKGNQNYVERHQKSFNDTVRSCPVIMRLTHSERYQVWRFDPCLDSIDALHGAFKPLPPQITISWVPTSSKIKLRMVATVMDEGRDACKSIEKHSCLHIDTVPIMCMANELLCDLVPNCPIVVSTDKDEGALACIKKKLKENLKKHSSSVDANHSSHLLEQSTYKETTTTIQDIEETTLNTEPPVKDKIPLSGLSQYGPWGFLLVGILICGALLVICGLWECYCRKPKPDVIVPSTVEGPDHVTDENTPSVPVLPTYDELDQPPSYSTLFPSNKFASSEAQTDETPEEVMCI